MLVTLQGLPVLATEGRGSRVAIVPGTAPEEVTEAAAALVRHLLSVPGTLRRGRDVEVRTIDGAPAATSRHAEAFLRAGFRRGSGGLRYLEPTR